MKTFVTLLLILFSLTVFAQDKIKLGGIDWSLNGEVVSENYKGKDCLKTDEGVATASDVTLKNGIVEFKMCIQPGRGFAGIRFRGDGMGDTEEFYIRKHQSGNPDAMQYTPVYNGNAGWQLYYGDDYGAVKKHVFDEWFQVKLAVSGSRGEVYISDMEKPVLVIHELKMGEREGKIAFYGPARYADIKISPMDSPELKGAYKEIVEAGDEVLTNYQVSDAFDAEKLINENLLPANFTKRLQFTNWDTEADGLLNISKTAALADKKNAVLLKITIDSETDLIKMMNFGFSDVAKIFVNGKAVWLGVDIYRSRDYRFLGTMGYFDSVYLDLKSGKNEILVMVAENFGGWGFKARFENLNGIKILN
ncbi:hypothetical protein SLH46_08295 [Draconibacterium sp. IB214405]|uniref:hypothetical protein n=1 Tax=Draconibacterium sp. IB214405 TaxID=3097352 RepID=UPI002A120C2C|nr:hypothetical protein [Draconibacterium sp. IB214405]MDX8339175.1 hypothetical protein [Draconibacterium sp. IB214405]